REEVSASFLVVFSDVDPTATAHGPALVAAYSHADRGALRYLERVDELEPDVRLALAHDRALLAWLLGDDEALRAGIAALERELAQRALSSLPTLVRVAI